MHRLVMRIAATEVMGPDPSMTVLMGLDLSMTVLMGLDPSMTVLRTHGSSVCLLLWC